MFTSDELNILNDALNMALASNKRMQNSKPKFAAVFQQIENDINSLKGKLLTINSKENKQK